MNPARYAADELAAHRPMLFGLAYRLLGSAHDADDVLQEAYLRMSRVDPTEVDHPRRYLSRVVTRLAVDALRARQARRELYPGTWLPEPVPTSPSDEPTLHRESMSLALLHLMEQLSPPQRAVYVLREAFAWPYAEIARAIDRQPDDCRQLYRRAAAALREGARRYRADRPTHERLLTRFLAAAREGDVDSLIRLLHDDAVAYSDGGGKARAARRPVHGAAKVARFFAGIYGRRVPEVRPVDLNGAPALLVTNEAGLSVFTLAVAGDRIAAIYLVTNPDKLRRVGLAR